MASGYVTQPVEVQPHTVDTSITGVTIKIIKFGRVASVKMFTDKNIPNETVLATLPINLRPYNDGGYPQTLYVDPVSITTDTDHKLLVDMETGKVIYRNPNNTNTWNVFYAMYITQ